MNDKEKTTTYGPGCDETGKINYNLPPRGVSFGRPLGTNLRNWDCRVDGHSDPDNSGLCIHCSISLFPKDDSDREWNREKWLKYIGDCEYVDPEVWNKDDVD